MATCTVGGCEKQARSHGLCQMHAKRLRLYGTTDDVPRKNARQMCSVEGCVGLVVAKGLCDNHYRQERHKRIRAEKRASEMPVCSYCGGGIPAERRVRGSIHFCSTECKQHAYRESGAYAEANLRYHFRKYGLTITEVEEMRRRGCDNCGRKGGEVGRHGQLHVDHDHVTGATRGVLCHKCNLALGNLEDDPKLILSLAMYLIRDAEFAALLEPAVRYLESVPS